MDDLFLSDTLQRYFSDVFLCCDDEFSGKASLHKTVELIKSGNVPEDVITQIFETCLGQPTLYLDRKQFFSTLKLVAAYQANIPLKPELLTQKIEIPLPRFTWTKLDGDNQVSDPEFPDLIELRNEVNDFSEHVDTISTDSEIDSDTLSIVRNGSPDASSAASDSPTPTNSVQDKGWAISGVWQGLPSEEHIKLLGTEEESSDRHSSEEDTEVSNEVWTITTEQREYYTNQFRSLQPDTNALLAGPVARMFFEKSRLPVQELRKIWQLADVTKDGALSLQEFNTAMHLVVLRKHYIELPNFLPPSLIPGDITPLSVSPETEPMLSPQTKDTAKEWTKFVDSPTSSVSSPGPKPVNFDFQKVIIDKESKIVQPKPLRLTPEVQNNAQICDEQIDSIDLNSPKKFVENNNLQVNYNLQTNSQNSAIQRPQPKKIVVPVSGGIPPPSVPHKNVETEGPVSLPAFPPPKKEKPPPPPPRPFKTHGRSSSLDLNHLSKLGLPPTVPPRVSPNIQTSKKLINQRSEGDTTTNDHFADFEQFEKYENVPEGIFPGEKYEKERKKLFDQFSSGFYKETDENAPRKHGAFEVYRPPGKNKDSTGLKGEEKQKWETFENLQEENTALLRICQELSQELADIREEKTVLKIKLEKQLNGG